MYGGVKCVARSANLTAGRRGRGGLGSRLPTAQRVTGLRPAVGRRLPAGGHRPARGEKTTATTADQHHTRRRLSAAGCADGLARRLVPRILPGPTPGATLVRLNLLQLDRSGTAQYLPAPHRAPPGRGRRLNLLSATYSRSLVGLVVPRPVNWGRLLSKLS